MKTRYILWCYCHNICDMTNNYLHCPAPPPFYPYKYQLSFIEPHTTNPVSIQNRHLFCLHCTHEITIYSVTRLHIHHCLKKTLTFPYPYLCHYPSMYSKYAPLPYTPIPAPPLFISSLFNDSSFHHTCASDNISVFPATQIKFYSWRDTTTVIFITVPMLPSLQSPCILWSLHT